MRWCLPLIIAVLYQLALAARFDYLLKSPHYLLISNYKCDTIFEAGINKEQICPLGLTPHNSSRQPGCDFDVRASLMRDPKREFPPKILYIVEAQPRLPFGIIENINLSINGDHQNISRPLKLSNTNKPTEFLDFKLFEATILATIYDSESHLLYIVYRKQKFPRSGPFCNIYLMRNVFGLTGKISADKIYEFGVHSNNGGRQQWTLDPFTNLVYYTTDNGDSVVLHSFPIARLLTVFTEGSPGEVVYTFTKGTRTHFRVSGDILFTHLTENDIQFSRVRNVNFKEERGMNCQYEETKSDFHKPYIISTIVVRDDDYCLVRDGRRANLDKCAEERKQWRQDNNFEPQAEKLRENGAWCTVLFIITLLLCFLLVTSCICICWMKRSLDESYNDEPPRPVPYYASRPGQYPEDVSVDKWNSNY